MFFSLSSRIYGIDKALLRYVAFLSFRTGTSARCCRRRVKLERASEWTHHVAGIDDSTDGPLAESRFQQHYLLPHTCI